MSDGDAAINPQIKAQRRAETDECSNAQRDEFA